MQNQTTSPPTTDGSGPAPQDPRAVFARSVATAGSVIAAVGPDQMALPTPCDRMQVTDLLSHLVMALDRVVELGRGEDPFAPGTHHVAPEVAPDEWHRLWVETAHRAQEAWTDDAVLGRTMVLPWMTAPGGVVLGGYVNEITVHTWDLATATGQAPTWDDLVVATALAGITQGLPAEGRLEIFRQVEAAMPEDQRSGLPPFAEAVPVPDDAPPIDRLVAWNGRRP